MIPVWLHDMTDLAKPRGELTDLCVTKHPTSGRLHSHEAQWTLQLSCYTTSQLHLSSWDRFDGGLRFTASQIWCITYKTCTQGRALLWSHEYSRIMNGEYDENDSSISIHFVTSHAGLAQPWGAHRRWSGTSRTVESDWSSLIRDLSRPLWTPSS